MSGLGEPAEPTGPRDPALSEVWIRDRRLECLVCGGAGFAYREVLLNTSDMTYLGLDWLNKAAVGVVCRSCGFVHEFIGGDHLVWRDPADPAAPWMDADGL